MSKYDSVGVDISSYEFNLWVNQLRWFQKIYRNEPFLPKTESPRESYLIISAEHKWILNYFSGRRWLWRSQCATSTMPCRQLCLENETTLVHHLVANYRYRFYRSFQYAITIIRCPINYFVSLSNSCFIFLHVITLDGARMKFLEYTDEIREGDTVIVYISSDDLKQIIIKKGETYQSKFG